MQCVGGTERWWLLSDSDTSDAGSWSVWAPGGFRVTGVSLAAAQRTRARGEIVVPDRYVEAPLHDEQLIWAIASSALDKMVGESEQRHGRRVAYGEIELRQEDVTHWMFWRQSPELQAEGWIPGAAITSIDKVDLHIWTQADFEEFSRWQSKPPQVL